MSDSKYEQARAVKKSSSRDFVNNNNFSLTWCCWWLFPCKVNVWFLYERIQR